MKKSLYPVLFLVLAFVVVLFADDTLFEGIKMTERLLITNTVNKASAILQAGDPTMPTATGSSLILVGTNGIGNATLRAFNSGGTESASLQLSSANLLAARVMGSLLMEYGPNVTQVEIGQSGSQLVLNATNIVFGSGRLAFGASAAASMIMAAGSVTTNFLGFTEIQTITASNFVQSAGSSGGYTGNGAGLTNLPGSGVGGFTSGSVIFAGPTGALSQNNPRFFWDNTNFALNINTNVTPAGVSLEVNGALQVEGPAIITSAGPITNIIGSVSGLIPSVYITNVSIDYASIPTLSGTNMTFSVPATILTNSVVMIGRPPTESLGLITVGLMTNNGIVSVRAFNGTAGSIDQAALPYRISIQVNPTQ